DLPSSRPAVEGGPVDRWHEEPRRFGGPDEVVGVVHVRKHTVKVVHVRKTTRLPTSNLYFEDLRRLAHARQDVAVTTSPHDYSDLELSVGDRLRRARERRTGLDQGEFAELINVSRGTVSNYERDRIPNGPRRRLVFNSWAAACGVAVHWLETGIDPRNGDDDG